jgi:hypothetical protein
MGAFYFLVLVDTFVVNPYLKIALGASLVLGLLVQHVVIQPATGCGLKANCWRAVMYSWAIWGFFVSALRNALELDDVLLGVLLAGALLIAPILYWANRLRARKFDRQDIAATILRVCRSADRHRANPTDMLQKQLEEIWLKEWLGDAAHDEQNRQDVILALQTAQSYTAWERREIDASRRLLSQFESSAAKRHPIKSRATVEQAETKRDDDTGGLLLGRTELLIRGATPRQIAAYLLNANDSRQENRHRWSAWTVRCCNLQTVNDHHVVSFYRCRASGFADRTFLLSIIAEQLLDDPLTYVVVVVPIPAHHLITATDEARAVRAECCRVYQLIEVAPRITRLTYACALDLKGLVPPFVTNMAIPAQMDGPLAMQAYFQQLRDPSECCAQDGVFVAHMLVDIAETLSGGKREIKSNVRKFAQRTLMLRASGFPHLSAMLTTVVTKSHVYDPDSASDLLSDSFVDPALVTEEEATAMGDVFAGVLRDSGRSATPAPSPATAVRKLIQTFAVLEVMAHKHVWFVPMLETIAGRLHESSVVDRRQSIDRGSSIHPGLANGNSFDGGISISSVGHQVSPTTLRIALTCSRALMERLTQKLLEYTEQTAGADGRAHVACLAQLSALLQIAQEVVGANELRKQHVLQLLLGVLEIAAQNADPGVGLGVLDVLEGILSHTRIQRLALAELRAFNGLERNLHVWRAFARSEPDMAVVEATRNSLLRKLLALLGVLRMDADRFVLVHSYFAWTAASAELDGVQLVEHTALPTRCFFVHDGSGSLFPGSLFPGVDQLSLVHCVLVVLDQSCIEPSAIESTAVDIRKIASQLRLTSPAPAVVVAVATCALNEHPQDTGLPPTFPFEPHDAVAAADLQVILLPQVIHEKNLLEEVAASLEKFEELKDSGRVADRRVRKPPHTTHYRPVVAPLPALQTELKPPSVASDSYRIGCVATLHGRAQDAWTDSAGGVSSLVSADTSTSTRVSREGAQGRASDDPESRFDWAMKQLQTFRNDKKKRRLEWGTHDATAETTRCDENDPFPWCMCTTSLCGGAAAVLAEILALDSPSRRFLPDVTIVVTGRPRPRSLKLTAFSRLPFGLAPTAFPIHLVWREECRAADDADASEKAFLLVFSPDPCAAHSDGAFTAVVLLQDLGGGRTQLEFLFRIDLRRQMQARSLIRSRAAEHILCVARHAVVHLKLRLLGQLPRDSIERSDAEVLAQALLSKRRSALGLGSVRVCIEKYRALRELRSCYPWIETMLVEILRNKLQPSFGHTAATSLAQVTLEQGGNIGKSFIIVLVWYGQAAPATQAWVRRYVALSQLHALHPWVFVMVEQIATVLLKKASLGIHIRVLFCGMLTYLDLGSDILVAKQYLESGEVTGAMLTISFLALNLILQVALCVVQNYRSPAQMWQEIGYSLILLKPGLEVVRVLFGHKQALHQTFPPLQENSYSKCIEVAAEALPAAVCQLFFYLRTTDPTALQLASIVVSIFTTAVTVASVDFNLNTDPRTLATEHGLVVRYYGLVPDGSIAEFCMFVVMVCCSFTQMAVVALGTALMADYDMRFAIGVWAVRYGSTYIVKLVQSDLSYFVPIRGIAGHLVTWCFARPFVMMVSDFTFLVYGRHPFEMGCVHWWSGRVGAWLLLIVAIALRAQPPDSEPTEPLLTNATLPANQSIGPMFWNAAELSVPPSATTPWFLRLEFLAALAAALFILWLVSHVAFFRLCKRECWKSFHTTHTAAAYVKLKWEAAENDEKRAALLVKLHPAVLRLITTNARLWIEAHWRECPDDRPMWMSSRWLRAVPSSMLPKKVLQALGGKHRRRSTLTERLELLGPGDVAVPGPVALSTFAVSSDSDGIVVDGTSSTEGPAPELLTVVPS